MAKGDRVIFDPAGIFLPGSVFSKAQLNSLAVRLNAIRLAITGESSQVRDSPKTDSDRRTCHCAFGELPERMLDDYVEHRQHSDLGRILQTARWIRDRIDRIVVVGEAGVLSSIRALLDACCQPYFHELTRSQRGGRPRVLLAGGDLDNDAIAGLITLLTEGRSPNLLEDRWALLLVDAPAADLPTKLVGRHLLTALRSFYREDPATLAEMVIPVIATGNGGWMSDRPTGFCHTLMVPSDIEEGFHTFSVVSLLPAAIVGMDVVRLLEGASAANDHFRTAPIGANAVLDYIGISHLWRTARPSRACGLRIWGTALHATARWYTQLRHQELGRTKTASGTDRDDESAVSAAAGIPLCGVSAEDVLWTEVTIDQCRCDPLTVGHLEADPDGVNSLAGRSQPDLLSEAIRDTMVDHRQDGCPAAVLRLTRLNEHTLGQLMQIWMLAVAAECRLAWGGAGSGPPGELGAENAKDFATCFLSDSY